MPLQEPEAEAQNGDAARWSAFATALALLAAAVALSLVSFETSESPDIAGPLLFPHLVLTVWMGTSLLVAVLNVPRSRPPGFATAKIPGALRLIAIAGLSGAFALLLPTLGFGAGALLFFIPVAVLCGERRFVILGLTSVVFILAVWALFTLLFGIPLPTGEIADWISG